MAACLLIGSKFFMVLSGLELISLPFSFPKASMPLSFRHEYLGCLLLENGLWEKLPTTGFDFPN